MTTTLIHANRKRTRLTLALLLFGIASLAPVQGNAQTVCASGAIKVVVPFAVGSVNDVLARAVAQEMGAALQKPMIAENRVGAGGMLATTTVAHAAPDGCTVGLATSSQMVVNVGLYKSLPFNIEKDLAYIGLISRIPLALVTGSSLLPGLQPFVDEAKKSPGRLTFGSAGNGSISHLVGEAFNRQAGIKAQHVPYKGNAAALVDLVGGHIDYMFDPLTTSMPMTEQGKIRILAVSGAKRSNIAPNVPTFAEAGMPGYEAYTWNGLIAPGKMPPALLSTLNVALGKALASQSVHRLLEQSGAEILGPSSPEQAAAFARTERDKWLPLIRSLNISMD